MQRVWVVFRGEECRYPPTKRSECWEKVRIKKNFLRITIPWWKQQQMPGWSWSEHAWGLPCCCLSFTTTTTTTYRDYPFYFHPQSHHIRSEFYVRICLSLAKNYTPPIARGGRRTHHHTTMPYWSSDNGGVSQKKYETMDWLGGYLGKILSMARGDLWSELYFGDLTFTNTNQTPSLPPPPPAAVVVLV